MRSWLGQGLEAVADTSGRLVHGARAAAVEATWIGAHLATYPLGLLRERAGTTTHPYRLDELDPLQRGLVVGDVEAAGTPILLVHGIVDNRTVFGLLRRGLARRGFGRILSFSYGPLPTDLRTPARRLAEVIERLCSEGGYERIHLVGHSLGGLIARYCVQVLGLHDRVHTLVTLGTPHAGTRTAYVLPHPLLHQLRPGSEMVEELRAPAPECSTRFLALWSDCDEIIRPNHHARLEHPDLTVRNVAIRGIGHLSLPISGEVVEEISTTLARLESDDAAFEDPPAARPDPRA